MIPLCFPPMGAPAIFEKQMEIKLLHPAFTEEVTDSGYNYPESVTSSRRSAQAIDSYLLPENFNETDGGTCNFWKTNRNQALTPCIRSGVTDSGLS
ncbi:MAG: hypothetical protein P8X79_12775 [Reinekea sp.]